MASYATSGILYSILTKASLLFLPPYGFLTVGAAVLRAVRFTVRFAYIFGIIKIIIGYMIVLESQFQELDYLTICFQ